MAKIQDLLADKHEDRLNYNDLLQRFPWISQRERYCVLSPDSDGLLCGLFMARYRGWKVVGFYDDKVSVINKSYLSEDIVFLDGEIFREGVKSLGHHMVCLTNKKRDLLESGFHDCIQPNLLRSYDKNSFRLKYPLASIHLLVSIIAYADKDSSPITLGEEAVAPLLFTDGVFSNLFKYPENILNWFTFLGINEPWNPLQHVFGDGQHSLINTIRYMDNFFRKRDAITARSTSGERTHSVEERGDRLKLSDSKGEPYNIRGIGTDVISIDTDAVDRVKRFCTMIGEMCEWPYREEDWPCWNNLEYFKFTKSSFESEKKTLTVANFEEFIGKNPLSWAQTSNKNIEYTLEEPSRFPF